MLQNKETCILNVHTTHTHTQLRIRETESQTDLPTPQKCVLCVNHLCTGQFSVAVSIFLTTEKEAKYVAF